MNKLIRLPEVDSTNEEARRLALRGAEEGTIVMADRQTAGRGRRGRSWYSDSADSLYFSILLRPGFIPDRASMVTLVAALATGQAIERISGLKPAIKWPNDLLLSEKKVCGILTELHMEEGRIASLIVGIGINVNQKNFPGDIASMATSLQIEKGKPVDKERLLSALCDSFLEKYHEFLLHEDLSFLQTEYNTALISRGRQVKVSGTAQELVGEALGINTAGELLVKKEDGSIEPVYAGEVSVRGIYGYV
ncbi:MAG: biotin--[Lachnospiraceae bacterium]|nr:biotin--[acetyl-CoA-carboxylase] ligase [Lachnospiraceae bacterium]